MSIVIPFSEACERNKDVILSVIKPYLDTAETVLEVGSGTAQHSIYFSQALKGLSWQTSDQLDYLEGINAALDNAKELNPDLTNVLTPFELNVNQAVWVEGGARYDVIYTANTFHIMNCLDVEKFFSGLESVSKIGTYVIVYGPFKYGGNFTSESNAKFDDILRSRGVGSAIRDFESVNDLASLQGLTLVKDHSMPANNQCLIWQRQS